MAAVPVWAAPGKNAWFRYLQFSSKKRSAIRTSAFFISPDGMKDESAEWQASVEAFRSNRQMPVEGQNMPYRCVFPARAELIEKITGEKFPVVPCPDLDRWEQAMGSERLSIIFAGAYSNNPASLFGHTLLRFQKAGATPGDRSQTLLSYSAGFLASTPPDDSQIETVFKGLMGLYLGFFNVRPYYINTALYNNSESRDLWEYPLKLSHEEVRWASLYLWELMHMAGMSYYFVDENCSYRLLTFLEAVRPDLDLTSHTSVFVLPIDTVRIMDDAGLVDQEHVTIEPSLRHRLEARLKIMSSAQISSFRDAQKSLTALEKTKDVAVLDALIDYWTARNYKALTNLPPAERVLFDRTFALRAEIPETGFQPTPESLRPKTAPDQGHRSSWMELQGAGGDQSVLKYQYRLGVHSLVMSAEGYDDFAAIEYFGVDFEHDVRTGQLRKGHLSVGDIAALNPWSWDFKAPSWSFGGGGRWEKTNDIERTWLEWYGGLGISFETWQRSLVFILPQARAQSDTNRSAAFIAPGLRVGFRWETRQQVYLLDSLSEEVDNRRQTQTTFRITYLQTVNQMLFAEAQSKERDKISREQSLGLGFRLAY